MTQEVVATLSMTSSDLNLLFNLFNKSLLASAQTNEGVAAAEAVTMLRSKIVKTEPEAEAEAESGE